jgi:hypothetical protein
MAARKKKTNHDDADPEFKAGLHPRYLMGAGGVTRFERDAVRKVRQHWLVVCERWQEELDASDLPGRTYASQWAKTLRRRLGIKAPRDRELMRAQTRERVRRFRARQKK